MGILNDAEDLSGGILWKAGAVAGGVAAVVLGIALTVSNVEKGHLQKDYDKVELTISDPHTGYLVQLAQSRTNVDTLTVQVNSQNDRINAISAADSARIAALTLAVDTANQAAAVSHSKMLAVMSAPLTAATACGQYDEVDARVLSLLPQ
jgi:hypothetical protein